VAEQEQARVERMAKAVREWYKSMP
jgi:hypothetical protein